MPELAAHFVTEAEYLRLEAASPVKHEYFQGRIYAMAGGSPAHSLIGSNLLGSMVPSFRGQPCRAVGSDQRVKIEATGLRTYPDTLIVCPPERYAEGEPHSLVNPKVVFEVLSPTTERYDRTDKFDHYKQIPSLTDYILVAQDRVRVEHFQRGPDNTWTQRSYNQRENHIHLTDPDLELPLAEIYDRLVLPAGLFILPSEDAAAEDIGPATAS